MFVPRSFRLPILIIFVEVIGLFVLFLYSNKKPKEPVSFIVRDIPILGQFIDKRPEEINLILKEYGDGIGGDWEVYIKDLDTNKIYVGGEKKEMPSASLYKLAIMNEVWRDLENGSLGHDMVLSEAQSGLDARLNPDDVAGPEDSDTQISYTVDDALDLMIRISDNYAALLLADKVGWVNAQANLGKVGIRGFDLSGNGDLSVTASSVGNLLERIYKGKAVSKQASSAMLGLLMEQTVNDRIPKLLPNDVIVAHKTGELDGVRNDAGIVFGQHSDYIFVFLTNTDDPLGAQDKIASTSKKIYDVLEK